MRAEHAAALARVQQEHNRAAILRETTSDARLADAACQADELRSVTPAAEAAAAEAAGLAEAQLRAVAEARSGTEAWEGRATALEAELAAARCELAHTQQARCPQRARGALAVRCKVEVLTGAWTQCFRVCWRALSARITQNGMYPPVAQYLDVSRH